MKAILRRNIFALIVGVIVLGWSMIMSGCCLGDVRQCEVIYLSPSGKPFPVVWGQPPAIQTKDYRPLPYGYGNGSSTLYHWIMKNKFKESNNK